MKIGARKPSIKKSLSARSPITKAKRKYSTKKYTQPIKTQKKKVYNKVYNATTIPLVGTKKSISKSKTSNENNNNYMSRGNINHNLHAIDFEYQDIISDELDGDIIYSKNPDINKIYHKKKVTMVSDFPCPSCGSMENTGKSTMVLFASLTLITGIIFLIFNPLLSILLLLSSVILNITYQFKGKVTFRCNKCNHVKIFNRKEYINTAKKFFNDDLHKNI